MRDIDAIGESVSVPMMCNVDACNIDPEGSMLGVCCDYRSL